MAFGAILQALAAGAGGAGQGIRAFQDDWTQHQDLLASERYQRGVLADRAADRRLSRDQLAADQSYRAEQSRLAGLRIDNEATRAETARIQAETASAREERLTASERASNNPVTEAARARVERAMSALDDMNEEMSDAELDRTARRWGFSGGFDEAVAAAQRTKMGEWQPTPRAQASMQRSRAESGYDVPGLSGPQQGRDPRQTRPRVDPTDLPVSVQSALSGAEATRAALGRYRSQVESYMQRGRVSRGLGQAGVPSEERDREIGTLESALKDVQLNAKELANLGVLNGPDLELMEELIGDPLSTGALVRNPSYTLSKLDAAERFIEGRVAAYQRLYGEWETHTPEAQAASRWDDLARGAHGATYRPENPYAPGR